MKTTFQIRNLKSEIRRQADDRGLRLRHGERGMVTVIFIALLAIMMVLVMVESSSLIRLHRNVKLLEQQQTKRLNASQTNAVPTAPKP